MTALYIHIPYCRSKCGYCDFASIGIDDSVPAYLHALAKEAKTASEKAACVRTLYIGGGTPTILSPCQIERLLDLIRKAFDLNADAEITLEANPCSLTPEKAAVLVACGVNRVSLGAQSFVDSELSLLGRSHSADDIGSAVSLLRGAGIENICLDLIFAIPNQTPESWKHSLARAIDLKPRHISAYALTLEPTTPLWHLLHNGDIERKSDEEELLLYEIARDLLTQNGYEHYEISNFAFPGRRSRHNMVYWANDEYIGLGAGAVSYIDGKRIANLSSPSDYIKAMTEGGSVVSEAESISLCMRAVETLIQRLRLSEGIDCADFENRFGIHPEKLFNGAFPELLNLGLLDRENGTIRPTIKGWHLANEVALKALS